MPRLRCCATSTSAAADSTRQRGHHQALPRQRDGHSSGAGGRAGRPAPEDRAAQETGRPAEGLPVSGEQLVPRVEAAQVVQDRSRQVARRTCSRRTGRAVPATAVRASASNKVSPSALLKPLRSLRLPTGPNSSEADTQSPSSRNSGHASSTASGTAYCSLGNRGYQNRPSTSSPRTRVEMPAARATASSTASRWLQEPLPRASVLDTGCRSSNAYTGLTRALMRACARNRIGLLSAAAAGCTSTSRDCTADEPQSSVGVANTLPVDVSGATPSSRVRHHQVSKRDVMTTGCPTATPVRARTARGGGDSIAVTIG